MIEQIELLAGSGTAALDVRTVGEGAKNPIPYDHAAAEISIAVVKVVGMMQLVVLWRGKEPVPNARAHGEVGVGNPPIAKAQSCTNRNDLGGCPEQRENDRRAEAEC